MGLLGRRGVVRNVEVVKLSPVSYDFMLYDDQFHRAVEALARGSWAEAKEIYDTRSDAWLFSGIVANERSSIRTDVLEAIATRERSALAITLLGAAQIRDAWAIRGGGRAVTVEQDAWAGFHDGLRKAEETLRLAARLDSASAEPWVWMLPIARGLQMGLEETRRRFEEAHSRDPFHPLACGHMMQMLCKKWSGSHEQMFDFARWIEKAAPPDSPARDCLPLAHFERITTPEEGEQFRASEYLRQPEVASEVQDGLERFLAASPSPATLANLSVLNCYSFVVLPQDTRSARLSEECFTRIADRPSALPWRYQAVDIAARFTEVRDAYQADNRARLGRQ